MPRATMVMAFDSWMSTTDPKAQMTRARQPGVTLVQALDKHGLCTTSYHPPTHLGVSPCPGLAVRQPLWGASQPSIAAGATLVADPEIERRSALGARRVNLQTGMVSRRTDWRISPVQDLIRDQYQVSLQAPPKPVSQG